MFDSLRPDNLSSSGWKYLTSSNISILIFIILNFPVTSLFNYSNVTQQSMNTGPHVI
jgi:hypothetical protein